MKTGKNFFYGVVTLAVIGVVIYFTTSPREKKREADPLIKTHSSSDSMTHSSPEVKSASAGTKPTKNPKDGSIKIVMDFIKSNVKNPDTFEFLEWSELASENGYWKVRCKYKGVSSFNAEVTTNAWFYIRNQKVVYTKIISKI